MATEEERQWLEARGWTTTGTAGGWEFWVRQELTLACAEEGWANRTQTDWHASPQEALEATQRWFLAGAANYARAMELPPSLNQDIHPDEDPSWLWPFGDAQVSPDCEGPGDNAKQAILESLRDLYKDGLLESIYNFDFRDNEQGPLEAAVLHYMWELGLYTPPEET